MNTANHVSDEDLALFGLQLLPEQEVSDALVHLEHCEACRQQIGRFQGDLAVYAMTSEMHSPPALARERLMRRVAKEKKITPLERVAHPEPVADAEPFLAGRNSRLFEMESSEESGRHRAPVVLAWVGWALAAGLAVVAAFQFYQRQIVQSTLNAEVAQLSRAKGDLAQDAQARDVLQTLTATDAMQAALHRQPAAGAAKPTPAPQAHVTYAADRGSLVFVASNLDPLPAGKTYELWVLPVEGDPIAAGTFKPDAGGNASVVLPDVPKGVPAKGFGVTIEADGGAKQPTLPIVLGM